MSHLIIHKTRTGYSKGYTLLFAVITAAIVLGVAVFIVTVSKKQYALSVAARDSMYALYAADSAMECAVATDIATGTPSSLGSVLIHCNDTNSGIPAGTAVPFQVVPAPDSSTWPGSNATDVVQAADVLISLDASSNGPCAKVTVAAGFYQDGAVKRYKTVIDSRGYNYCNSTGPVVSPRTVERALRLTYR